MTQVSRLPLPKDLEEQMYSIFRRSLAGLTREEEIAELLDDLLTPTEKVMLAKRLAIAVLLEKGYDQRAIHRIMRVSTSTVSAVNFWRKHKGAGYRRIGERVKREQAWQDFLGKVDKWVASFSRMSKSIYPVAPRETRHRDKI